MFNSAAADSQCGWDRKCEHMYIRYRSGFGGRGADPFGFGSESYEPYGDEEDYTAAPQEENAEEAEVLEEMEWSQVSMTWVTTYKSPALIAEEQAALKAKAAGTTPRVSDASPNQPESPASDTAKSAASGTQAAAEELPPEEAYALYGEEAFENGQQAAGESEEETGRKPSILRRVMTVIAILLVAVVLVFSIMLGVGLLDLPSKTGSSASSGAASVTEPYIQSYNI